MVAAFRSLVEAQYRNRRTVAWYARKLGRSERTLHRATRLVLGRSAREVISERGILVAKRLLVHSRLAVHEIAAELGFDEPSNFVKAFKREVGSTPTTFRACFAGP